MPNGRLSNRRLVLAGAVVGVSVGMVGIAAASDWRPSSVTPNAEGEPSGTPQQVAASAQPGPGLAPDEAVARVVTSLGDKIVTGATVISDPKADGHKEAPPWVQIQLRSDGENQVEDTWLGQLVGGASADLMRTTEPVTRDVVGDVEIVDTDSSGKQETTPLGMGSAPGGQVFNSPSDADLAKRVQDVAGKFGVTEALHQVLHPLDSALAVTFTVPDGDVSWSIDDLQSALEGSPSSLEGLYIELDSPDGSPIVRSEVAHRVAGGGIWFADGQDDRFGIAHG